MGPCYTQIHLWSFSYNSFVKFHSKKKIVKNLGAPMGPCYIQIHVITKRNCIVLASEFRNTVKPVLSGHSKQDQKLVFKTDYRLMQVESIAAFCNTFDLH